MAADLTDRRPFTRRVGRLQPQEDSQRAVFRRLVAQRPARDQNFRQPIDGGDARRRRSRFGRRRGAWHQIGTELRQTLRLLADLAADSVADAGQIAQGAPVYRKQVAHGMDTHAVEHVLRFDPVAQFGDRGLRRGPAGDGVEAGILDLLQRRLVEHVPPCALHVLGIVEPFARVAA
ncbi:hypothetical protein N825_00620 [Skermanella stibiiresistens SB22]|uniref:Uncharacterized protein n=1 Tax=Skermanella stibiiresistens SB22 TaxID=1385369 RepID=W9HDM0_9PROT|nr:hypothetical protein N825_00620 [Skermanella stibiiresistens SB22]